MSSAITLTRFVGRVGFGRVQRTTVKPKLVNPPVQWRSVRTSPDVNVSPIDVPMREFGHRHLAVWFAVNKQRRSFSIVRNRKMRYPGRPVAGILLRIVASLETAANFTYRRVVHSSAQVRQASLKDIFRKPRGRAVNRNA